MTSQEIRQQFIEFFKDKGHRFVPSAPVVPQDDPTLLFTNAGMNQFKDIFLGKGTRDYKRAVNSQKCIRVSGKHNDLEEVGNDTYHHTFFEMLGNWSFADYYKEEAITWAWELLTDVWKLPKAQLYATVHTTDDEAEKLWAKVTDVIPKHILRFGDKDNFWEMGASGPCGPCSEIHIDLGPDRCDRQGEKHVCGVNGDCGRYIELWNLVFIQYLRDEQGALHPLPQRHVDTGAGFERLVAVIQNKASNYDTDVFMPLIQAVGEISGQDYASSKEQNAFRVIADHLRMLTFAITDGGLPSNEGRGYVMRRILRRAARYGRKLNMHEPFIYKLVPALVDLMGAAYPEIAARMEHVQAVIQAEEVHFNQTLDRGLEIFEKIKTDLQQRKQTLIPGKDVFRLYDTYGFPVDLTRILAQENNLELDVSGFEQEMDGQRERARAASRFAGQDGNEGEWVVLKEGEHSLFRGYENSSLETRLMRYRITAENIYLVLKETPFYAESGGQVGDRGKIILADRELEVLDTQKDGEAIVHICRSIPDFTVVGETVLAEVQISRRRDIMKNHTATHLLHAALRRVAGEHITQAGSLVQAGRLRFDFTHFQKLSSEQIIKIEKLVNEKIQQNIELRTAQEKFNEAKEKGAMALFGEKYGDMVRTVQIGDFSLELCGGTHVRRTGEIGALLILNETGIAAGVRRIEAITGSAVVAYLQRSRDMRRQLSATLNSSEDEIAAKVQHLLDDKRKLEKSLKKAQTENLKSDVDSIIASAKTVNGVLLIERAFTDLDVDQLKSLADHLRAKSPNTVALFHVQSAGRINFVCAVSDDLVEKKQFSAGDIVREVAKTAGGGGGGRPHLAMAGGKDVSKIDEAMKKFEALVAAAAGQ